MLNLAVVVIFAQLVGAQNNGSNALGTCYDPTGTPVDGFYPCQPSYITQCCPIGWTCYSNGLCVVTDTDTANATFPLGTSIRGACTKPEWNSQICGGYCLNVIDAGGALDACGNDEFCCAKSAAQGLCNCKTGNNTFNIPAGVAETVISAGAVVPTQTPTVNPSMTGSMVTTSSSTTSSSHTPGSAASNHSSKRKSHNKLGIGLGVGLGALFILLILVLVCCCIPAMRRRRQRSQVATYSPSNVGEHNRGSDMEVVPTLGGVLAGDSNRDYNEVPHEIDGQRVHRTTEPTTVQPRDVSPIPSWRPDPRTRPGGVPAGNRY